MSTPARAESAKPPRYRYPEQLTADELAEMERSVALTPEQLERYLAWLETGDGPDPCEELFG